MITLKSPRVTVTDDNQILLKGSDLSQYRAGDAELLIDPAQIDELVVILGHAKIWAQVCAKATKKTEPTIEPPPVTRHSQVAEDNAEDEAPL